MNALDLESTMRRPIWYREENCSVDDLAAALAPGDANSTLQFHAGIQKGVPIYASRDLTGVLDDASRRPDLLAEWAQVLSDGAGVFVLQRAYEDTHSVDDATDVFEAIIQQEREAGGGGGDHFAKAGANDRIWNAQEKLCLKAPDVFARYFGNAMLAAASEAWLGPAYQMTSQVNVVRPGGAAQQAHRDFHLGFLTVEQAQRYPAHVHAMSPFLTLQGAVAHSDMPVESGPTKLLPYSQRYAAGYVAWRRQDMRDYFEAHCVQLPLAKGDALFFNPALFHAAGSNRTPDVQRMANLLQVSSPYGRAMESVDRTRMCAMLYPVLSRLRTEGRITDKETHAVIASCAEGYAFPTDLDRNPPLNGLAPPTQQDLFHHALRNAWPPQRFEQALAHFNALDYAM